MKEQLLDDFAFFTKHYLDAHECDPEYPVLRALQAEVCSDEESRLWHTLVYLIYGEVLSGHVAYTRAPCPEMASCLDSVDWKLPTAIERRGFRDPTALQKHVKSLLSYIDKHGTIQSWLTKGFTGHKGNDWYTLLETLLEPWGNGRWASYTTAEALICVQEFPVVAMDLGNAYSSGPRLGLSHLFGKVDGDGVAAVRQLDEQAEFLHDTLANKYGLSVRWEELETVLCNFHELVTGKLYIGRGVDRQLENIQLFRSRGFVEQADAVLRARRMALPTAYLGEIGGWSCVDQARKRAYLETGQIVLRGGTKQ